MCRADVEPQAHDAVAKLLRDIAQSLADQENVDLARTERSPSAMVGAAGQVKAKAAVRAELLGWGLGDATVDPGEVLLRLVTQSAARAERYAILLEDAYEAAERLKRSSMPAHSRSTKARRWPRRLL